MPVTKGEGYGLRELSAPELDSLLATCIEFRDGGTRTFRKKDFVKANSQYFSAAELLRDVTAEGDDEVRVREQHILCLRNWALAALKAELFKDVIDATNRLLTLSPEDTKGLYRRGRARWRLGDLEGAQADLEQIIAICPDQEDRNSAKNALAHLNRDMKAADQQMKKIMRQAVIKDVLGSERSGENLQMSEDDRLQMQMRRLGIPPSSSESTAPASQPPARVPKVPKQKDPEVESFTVEQARSLGSQLHTLYCTPQITKELNALRTAADYDLIPFLRRLRPQVRMWAAQLAEEYGLNPQAVNEKGEGHIAQVINMHMKDAIVSEQARANYKFLLGDVFED